MESMQLLLEYDKSKIAVAKTWQKLDCILDYKGRQNQYNCSLNTINQRLLLQRLARQKHVLSLDYEK